MRLVYALAFSMTGSGKALAFDQAAELTIDWVKDWHQTHGVSVQLPSGAGDIMSDGEVAGFVNTYALTDQNLRYWTLEWRQQHDFDSGLIWVVNCDLAEVDGTVADFSVAVRIDSRDFRVAPAQFKLGPPGIIRRLAVGMPCAIGPLTISDQPLYVDRPDVPQLAEKLQNPDRRNAIVVVSRDPFSEQPLVEPSRLANRLIGLAEVNVITKAAGFELAEAVGQPLSCYRGAIRVYFPGFRLDDEPRTHWRYLPDELERRLALGNDFTEFLLGRLAAAAAFRYMESPVIRELRSKVAQSSAAEREALIGQIKGELDEEHQELVDFLQESAAAAEQERESYRSRVIELEDELASLRKNFEIVSIAGQPDNTFVASDDPTPLDYENVLAAVRDAESQFGDQLLFLDSALEAAGVSPYKQPSKVFALLKDLADVARLWQDARAAGKGMGKSHRQLLKERNWDYKERVSQTSRTKWADDYTFSYEGDRRLFEPHVTFTGGQPDGCLSVHMLWDDANGKLVIAHVGRHLTNTST